MGLKEIQELKNNAGKPKPPKQHIIPKKSAEKLAREAAEKEERGGNDTLMENWHKARRREAVGICQCGCGQSSQKKDDMWFRSSNAHIFPKAKFPSVMYHPLNRVERAVFGGCHTNMDEGGLDKWPNMADFDDIKEKFHILAPLLTDEERAAKFYSKLEQLIYAF